MTTFITRDELRSALDAVTVVDAVPPVPYDWSAETEKHDIYAAPGLAPAVIGFLDVPAAPPA